MHSTGGVQTNQACHVGIFGRAIGDAATRGMTSSPWVRRVAVPPIEASTTKWTPYLLDFYCDFCVIRSKTSLIFKKKYAEPKKSVSKIC